MANFRLLPSGNWNAQVRVKGKSPQSKTFSTRAEAESWASQIEAVTMDRKHHTIYTLGMTYCETMLKGKGSYQHALKVVKHLGRHFTQPIQDITPKMINDFKIMRLKTVKPSTCRIQLAFMSRFYRFAKRELLINIHNPVSDRGDTPFGAASPQNRRELAVAAALTLIQSKVLNSSGPAQLQWELDNLGKYADQIQAALEVE